MENLDKLDVRISAKKWAHPELEGIWNMFDPEAGGTDLRGRILGTIYNFDIPQEERLASAVAEKEASAAAMGLDGPLPENAERFEAPGCPEDPDAPEVEMTVVYPEGITRKKGLKAVYYMMGGGLYATYVNIPSFTAMANQLGCAVVVPAYRVGLEAPYPAAMNDLHAGYQWMVGKADELGVNPDRVVLYGTSSGSHLALSLAHRLKRYGYSPRGCVVESSFADNRPIYPTSKIEGCWDSSCTWASAVQYLGANSRMQEQSPEMFPNSCAPEDCVGLCPTFIHGDVEEGSWPGFTSYCQKLTQAGVFNEFHCWGGSNHGGMMNLANMDIEKPLAQRYRAVVFGNINDCLTYDLRRAWVRDELGM